MAIGNIDSNKVNMFPSSLRSGVDSYSRFTTEYNIVNMIDRITDVDKYVNTLVTGTGGYLEFTLGGYYFKCDLDKVLEAASTTSAAETGTTVYVVATVGYTTSESVLNKSLLGWSSNDLTYTLDTNNASGKFNCLLFTTSEDDVEAIKNRSHEGFNVEFYDLAILEKASSGWIVPSGSKSKFTADSLSLEDITNSEIDALFA